MTARERLFAVLSGKPVDRLPVWLLFPYHTCSYYVDVRTNPCYVPIFEKSKQRAIMLDRRNQRASFFAPEVKSNTEETRENGCKIRRWTLSYGGKTLVSETRWRGDQCSGRRLLESEEDLDVLLTFPINKDPQRIAEEMAKNGEQYLKERAEFPIEYGSMMLDMGEPIGFLYSNTNLQEFAVWSLVCSDKVVRFLDNAMEHYRLIYNYTLQRDWADVYFLVGSELASPPMVGRETFQKWIVPYAKEIIGMIHAKRKFAIQHYHGQIKLILEDFVTMGADGLHTIEAPPTGNCTLSEAYDVIGEKIALIGNIQYDLFRSMTSDEMKEQVRKVVCEANGRRFILSPTAGPYEETISRRIIENYMAFLEAAAEF